MDDVRPKDVDRLVAAEGAWMTSAQETRRVETRSNGRAEWDGPTV